LNRVLLIGLLVFAVPARAQWVAAGEVGRTPGGAVVYGEGPGFRLGASPLTLHLGGDVDTGGDSNIVYSSVPVAAAFLSFGAHLDLATLPPQAFENDNSTADQKVVFRLHGHADYRQYLSADPAVRALSILTAHANADLVVLPKGKYTFALSDRFERTMAPLNGEAVGNFTRDSNQAGALLTLRPGAGTIEFGAGDQVLVNVYESSLLTFGNAIATDAKLFARWLVPETAGVKGAFVGMALRAGYVDFWGQNGVINSAPLRAAAESAIQPLRWLSLSGSIGYGNSFNVHGPSFNSAIGAAMVSFLLPHEGKLSLSYDRDFAFTLYANYFAEHHPSIIFGLPIGERFMLRLQGGVSFRHYEGLTAPATLGDTGYSAPTRDDVVYDASAELLVRMTDWMWLGGSYDLFGDFSQFFFISANHQTPVTFVKHTAMATLRISY
jgi:hypothetical protein